MKLVLIQDTGLSSKIAFSSVVIRTALPESIQPGTNVVAAEFSIKDQFGNELKDFVFTVEESLARMGVLLVHAGLQDGYVRAILYNLGTETVELPEGSELIKASAYEGVVLRQASVLASPASPKKAAVRRRARRKP